MKKIFLSIAILSMIISISGCKIENEDTNLIIGTWVDSWKDDDGDTYKEKYTFTDNEFIYNYEGFTIKSDYYHTNKEPTIRTDSGTYKADSSTITFFIIV
jgi:hypothetical protein